MKSREPDRSTESTASSPAAFRITDRRHGEEEFAPAVDPVRAPTFVEKLESEKAQLKNQLKELSDHFKHSQKEMDQARERMNRDIEKRLDRVKAEFFRAALPLIDDFERAIEAAQSARGKNEIDLEALLSGFELVHRNWCRLLEAEGVERIQTLRTSFDPKIAEAVDLVPASNEHPENTIVEELQPGYQYKGELLREAKVRVAKSSL